METEAGPYRQGPNFTGRTKNLVTPEQPEDSTWDPTWILEFLHTFSLLENTKEPWEYER